MELETNDAYITNTSHDLSDGSPSPASPQEVFHEIKQNVAYIPTPSIPVEPNTAYATTPSIPVEPNTAYATTPSIPVEPNTAYAKSIPTEADAAYIYATNPTPAPVSSDHLYAPLESNEEHKPDRQVDYDYVVV